MPHTVTNRQGWPPDQPGMLRSSSHPTQALPLDKSHKRSLSGWAGYQPHKLCSCHYRLVPHCLAHTPNNPPHSQNVRQLGMVDIPSHQAVEPTRLHTPRIVKDHRDLPLRQCHMPDMQFRSTQAS